MNEDLKSFWMLMAGIVIIILLGVILKKYGVL